MDDIGMSWIIVLYGQKNRGGEMMLLHYLVGFRYDENFRNPFGGRYDDERIPTGIDNFTKDPLPCLSMFLCQFL